MYKNLNFSYVFLETMLEANCTGDVSDQLEVKYSDPKFDGVSLRRYGCVITEYLDPVSRVLL